MKIRNIKNISVNELQGVAFDLILVSSGFESRATNLISKIPLSSKNQYCFSFKSFDRNIARRKNDKFFRDSKFRSIVVAGDDDKVAFEWIVRFLDRYEDTPLDILIDYSCMTRVWYGAILNFFRHHQSKSGNLVNVYFSYSSAHFSPAPKTSPRNVHVGPIKGFSNISAPYLPTALIIGLGYIPERAYGLKEYLDAVPFLFYTDSSDGSQFASEVESTNRHIISEVNPENIYTYPLRNLEHTFYQLLDLCKDLKTKFRIVLAPCGPKPFTLISLLVAIHLDDVDVWRISAGDKEKPTDKVATGDIITAKIEFSN